MHRQLARTIKHAGGLAGIQLVHSGGKSQTSLTNEQLLGPSSIVVPTKDRELETPREMTREEIKIYQDCYLEAAIRAANSGYDIIELHCAHGYGLHQWLSPLTNKRAVDYGGSLTNRSRMLIEIFQKIRSKLPNKIIGARIPGEDHFEGGLTKEDMFAVSEKLQALGADFLDVSSGIGGWRRPDNRQGQGYLLPEAASIQSKIQIPVIGVGGIESGDFIDQALSTSQVSFTAIGRKILKDPKSFFNEVLASGY